MTPAASIGSISNLADGTTAVCVTHPVIVGHDLSCATRLHYGRSMITIRRALPAAAALTIVLASCGGSSDGGADDVETLVTVAETVADSVEDFTEGEGSESDVSVEAVEPVVAEPEESVAEETVAAPVESVEPAADPTDTADAPTVGDAASAGIDVALSEWEVDAPDAYAAGEITFNASNGGNFPHEFVVIAGAGYESLPRTEVGAVIEDDLPTGALIGRTGRIGGGSSESLTVTLAPGNYVLLCNLGGGNNSHAGQGQRLDITVS